MKFQNLYHYIHYILRDVNIINPELFIFNILNVIYYFYFQLLFLFENMHKNIFYSSLIYLIVTGINKFRNNKIITNKNIFYLFHFKGNVIFLSLLIDVKITSCYKFHFCNMFLGFVLLIFFLHFPSH